MSDIRDTLYDSFDHVPFPLWELDLSGLQGGDEAAQSDPHKLIHRIQVIRANQGALDLAGLSSSEEIEQNLSTIVPPETLELLIRGGEILQGSGNSYVAEGVLWTLQGTRRFVRLHLKKIPSVQPPLSRVLLSTEDISGRREVQQQLSLLSLLPEANPNIVFIRTCQGEFEYANPAARQWVHQYKEAHTTPPPGLLALNHLLPPHLEKNLCPQCRKTRITNYQISFEDQIFDMKARPLAGRQQCLFTLTDITERERITREKELYYQAFQSSIQGIIITNPQGIIEYVNPKIEELYGYALKEFVGARPSILNPGRRIYRDLGYTDEDFTQLFQSLWTSIQDPRRGSWEGVVANRTREGRIVWVRLIINALKDGKGQITHFIGFPVDITQSREQERSIRIEMLQTITETAEMRDNETGSHILRVGLYARLLAEEMGMPRKFCEDIQIFAQHHDIGKVGISDQILLAPRRLSDDEFTIMKSHPVLAHHLLGNKSTMTMADQISYSHHERYDGKGYPVGLSGEAIPLAARITSLADVYDALRSKRPYKGAWSHQKARDEIKAQSGKQFDPRVVEAFMTREAEFQEIATQYGEAQE